MVKKDHSRACRFRAFLVDFFLKFAEIFAFKVHHRYQHHHAENFANGTTCVVDTGDKLSHRCQRSLRQICRRYQRPLWDTYGLGGNCYKKKSEVENLVEQSL
jgi:hypothetical protein